MVTNRRLEIEIFSVRKDCEVIFFWESKWFDEMLEDYKPAGTSVAVGKEPKDIFRSILAVHHAALANPDIKRKIINGKGSPAITDNPYSYDVSEYRSPVDYWVMHVVQNDYDLFKRAQQLLRDTQSEQVPQITSLPAYRFEDSEGRRELAPIRVENTQPKSEGNSETLLITDAQN